MLVCIGVIVNISKFIALVTTASFIINPTFAVHAKPASLDGELNLDDNKAHQTYSVKLNTQQEDQNFETKNDSGKKSNFSTHHSDQNSEKDEIKPPEVDTQYLWKMIWEKEGKPDTSISEEIRKGIESGHRRIIYRTKKDGTADRRYKYYLKLEDRAFSGSINSSDTEMRASDDNNENNIGIYQFSGGNNQQKKDLEKLEEKKSNNTEYKENKSLSHKKPESEPSLMKPGRGDSDASSKYSSNMVGKTKSLTKYLYNDLAWEGIKYLNELFYINQVSSNDDLKPISFPILEAILELFMKNKPFHGNTLTEAIYKKIEKDQVKVRKLKADIEANNETIKQNKEMIDNLLKEKEKLGGLSLKKKSEIKPHSEPVIKDLPGEKNDEENNKEQIEIEKNIKITQKAILEKETANKKYEERNLKTENEIAELESRILKTLDQELLSLQENNINKSSDFWKWMHLRNQVNQSTAYFNYTVKPNIFNAIFKVFDNSEVIETLADSIVKKIKSTDMLSIDWNFIEHELHYIKSILNSGHSVVPAVGEDIKKVNVVTADIEFILNGNEKNSYRFPLYHPNCPTFSYYESNYKTYETLRNWVGECALTINRAIQGNSNKELNLLQSEFFSEDSDYHSERSLLMFLIEYYPHIAQQLMQKREFQNLSDKDNLKIDLHMYSTRGACNVCDSILIHPNTKLYKKFLSLMSKGMLDNYKRFESNINKSLFHDQHIYNEDFLKSKNDQLHQNKYGVYKTMVFSYPYTLDKLHQTQEKRIQEKTGQPWFMTDRNNLRIFTKPKFLDSFLHDTSASSKRTFFLSAGSRKKNEHDAIKQVADKTWYYRYHYLSKLFNKNFLKPLFVTDKNLFFQDLKKLKEKKKEIQEAERSNWNFQGNIFQELSIAPDGDCGFTALGLDRGAAVQRVLNILNEQEDSALYQAIRETLLAELREIMATIPEITELAHRYNPDNHEIAEYVRTVYGTAEQGGRSAYLGYGLNTTGMLAAVARAYNIAVEVFVQTQGNQLHRMLEYTPRNPTNRIRMLHTRMEVGGDLNHFNLLIDTSNHEQMFAQDIVTHLFKKQKEDGINQKNEPKLKKSKSMQFLGNSKQEGVFKDTKKLPGKENKLQEKQQPVGFPKKEEIKEQEIIEPQPSTVKRLFRSASTDNFKSTNDNDIWSQLLKSLSLFNVKK